MKPVVAIVGRPNVGKSTIFNRIIGQSTAIVDDTPGVTRDRLYGDAQWLKHSFMLIDTGGIQWAGEDFSESIAKQANIAIDEADVILMVVDSRTGATIEDERVARILQKNNKPVVLAVNKVDNFAKDNAYEFYTLGLGDPIPISAAHGTNMGDLLDAIVSYFDNIEIEEEDEEEDDDSVKIALVGRPNVGKSSLLNKLCNEERVIVSDIAGTTRDAIDEKVTYYGKDYTLIDTAGIRRKSKVGEFIEKVTVIRSVRAMERADVVFVLIDAVEGLTEQDKRIAGTAEENGKATVLVVNKWDLIKKDSKTMATFEEDLRDKMSFMNYAPIVFISALTGQRIGDLYKLADLVYTNAHRKIETSTINQLLREIVAFNPPPSDKGRPLKINYGTQIKVAPPSFALFVNDVELMHFSYKRHIENKFREAFDITGTPIRIYLRNKKGE
ncbi:ribosome biogenesis GTPase Der [endosymbiont 'TC1' of Trimyema compressum]|uniref:ribosome biogenesis GTPase Der n=1 Tax=endosymbiont 'TC1' of Trimyema compressum TaxID=243899 RepID=UPI0007F0D03A|nr:ribosome biogenesis GTPase Der [endosymbiont 'TC1' of Trimyema compressum]AMP20567.1 ribosome biogenesis GTPase Der [endosymbiont 'TC1' of Trimyema compressum]